ncbi:MAG: fimbrillin family protein [Bacteroidales bacterium]|nr:fimbrillin family protein [Bacteroidales bacterium]
MKTNQLILAAALVVLAACNKANVEPVNTGNLEGDEIGFVAVNKKATKANDAIITGTTYGTDNTFKVWGWQSQVGDFSEFAEGDASNFMSNLTISWTKGAVPATHDLEWRNEEHYYYWPFTGSIGFLAIHPSDLAAASYDELTPGWDDKNDKAKASITDYTISADNKTVDLMFASKEGSRASIAKVGDGKVAMVFKHALSQIQFRVRTNDDYSADVTFKVNSVTINNVDLSGDLAYANSDFAWSDNADQTENWPYYATTATVAYAATDAAAALYGDANVMIPQAANVDDPATTEVLEGTTLTINYTMEQTGSAAITGDVTVGAAQEWVAGKKYIYTLNFKLNEILFPPEVTDWVDVEIATINILD